MILETHGAGAIKKQKISNSNNSHSHSHIDNDRHGYKWEINLIRKL